MLSRPIAAEERDWAQRRIYLFQTTGGSLHLADAVMALAILTGNVFAEPGELPAPEAGKLLIVVSDDGQPSGFVAVYQPEDDLLTWAAVDLGAVFVLRPDLRDVVRGWSKRAGARGFDLIEIPPHG